MAKFKQAQPAPEYAEPPTRRLRTQAVGGLLRKALGPLSASHGAQLAHILPFWPSICPLLHAHGVPESLRAGVLTIAASTSSAKREFMFLAPSLIEGANRVIGYEAVQRVQCVVRGQTNSARGSKLAAQLSPPLPTNAAAADKALKVCQNVKDEGLREALLRLGTRALAG